MNHSNTDVLQEREKSIHRDLADERKKYAAIRSINKTRAPREVEKIMPVTNVTTHVRRTDDNMQELHRVDNNDIMIQGSMLPCQTYRVNNKTSYPDNIERENREMNLYRKSIPEHLSSSENCIPNQTCKCCGIMLSSNMNNYEDSNVCKSQCFPADTDLECFIKSFKYPLTTETSTKSQCKLVKTITGHVAPRKEYREIDVEESVSYHLQTFGQTFGRREYFSPMNNAQESLRCCTERGIKPEKDLTIHENYEKMDCANVMKNEQRDERHTDWKGEAKKVLLEIGANIKIVNGVEKRNNVIRSEQLASWCLGKWKQFTENNKGRRNKLEKLKLQREMNLMRSYFLKWKIKSDEKRREKKERAEKTDVFLSFLRFKQLELKQKEKAEENMKKTKSTKNIVKKNEFKNRLNIQRDIILSQKKKIAKAEEEMREMKLKQILEQSKESRNVVVENVKETIRHIDPKLKVAAHQIINLRHENYTKSSDEKAKMLVESMEQRAKERKLKWQQIQERKKQKAEETVKMLQEQETKRLEEDEEKKRIKIQQLKEKRRLDKENAIQRENERRRLESLTIIAENFHKKKLKQRSLRAFRENLRNIYIKMELAEKYYIYQLKRKFFMEWKFYTEEVTAEKMHLAAHFYDFILKRRVFDSFKEVCMLR